MPSTKAATLAALLLLCGLPVPGQTSSSFDPAEFDKVARTLRCDCGCHPQSVQDCACGRAAEMRREIAAALEGGLRGDEVIARYVERQGEQIRLAPTARGFNLVAWLGPLLGLLLGCGALILLIRRWKRAQPVEQKSATPAISPADGTYYDRLRDALERMD